MLSVSISGRSVSTMLPECDPDRRRLRCRVRQKASNNRRSFAPSFRPRSTHLFFKTRFLNECAKESQKCSEMSSRELLHAEAFLEQTNLALQGFQVGHSYRAVLASPGQESSVGAELDICRSAEIVVKKVQPGRVIGTMAQCQFRR